MSAGAITGTTSTEDLPEDDVVLELTGGENPLTFLGMNRETILGLIACMSDPDRIEGWRRAEEHYVNSDRTVVLEALERQRLCLERGDEPPIYHPVHDRYDPNADPLEDDDRDGDAETSNGDEPENRHEPHPEANLEAGKVLVVNREDSTEYVWPARADAGEPYILREFVDGELQQERTIGTDGAFKRVHLDSEKKRTDFVDVETPLEAAVNGGDGGD